MVATDPRNLMFNDVQYLITIVLIGSLAMILQCTCHIKNCDLKAQKDTFWGHAPRASDVRIQEVGFF